MTAQEELELDLELDMLFGGLLDFESFGEFLEFEELNELHLSKWTNTTFGEKFMNMRKVYPLKGVIVSKGYICLVDK